MPSLILIKVGFCGRDILMQDGRKAVNRHEDPQEDPVMPGLWIYSGLETIGVDIFSAMFVVSQNLPGRGRDITVPGPVLALYLVKGHLSESSRRAGR